MVAHDFAKFVESQQSAAAETKVDWAAVRDEWLAYLDSLHRQVIGFLGEYVNAGSLSYSFSEVQLTEEDIGTYSAKRMDIKIGRQYVRLEPVGRMFIGCRGRVDVVGAAGRAQFILVGDKAKTAADLFKVTVTVGTGKIIPAPTPPPVQSASWAWKIVTHTGQRRLLDLEQESFFALLMEIANA